MVHPPPSKAETRSAGIMAALPLRGSNKTTNGTSGRLPSLTCWRHSNRCKLCRRRYFDDSWHPGGYYAFDHQHGQPRFPLYDSRALFGRKPASIVRRFSTRKKSGALRHPTSHPFCAHSAHHAVQNAPSRVTPREFSSPRHAPAPPAGRFVPRRRYLPRPPEQASAAPSAPRCRKTRFPYDQTHG